MTAADYTSAYVKPNVVCPECGSQSCYRNGHGNEGVQRYLCRTCGYRFRGEGKLRLKAEEPHVLPCNLPCDLKDNNGPLNSSQICANQLVKNLEPQTEIKTVAGDSPTTLQHQITSGKIVEYEIWATNEGNSPETITRRRKLLNVLVKRGANLLDSESMKASIAKQKSWSNKTKQLGIEAYTSFLKAFGETWNPPKYMQIRKLPFVPLEREIDELIAGCNPKTATFLRLLKETGARFGEAWQLEWIAFDFDNKSVNITPEKGSNPRKLKIGDKLISMLNNLPKNQKQVFQGSKRHFVRSYRRQRERIAFKLKNDRIRQISFKTFRTFKASTEIAKHRTLKEVQYMLGHKSIVSTDYYVQLVDFGSDDFTCQSAKTVAEAQKLIEAGFEYVCEMEDVKLFRKRK